MIDETFVLGKVHALFSRFAEENGALSPPIDPARLASLCGVLKIEYRRMVPEGVLAPVEGGFTIYLQDNFVLPNRKKARERFSLAHELAHTFFYDKNPRIPKPMRGSPRGERLEYLCQVAASEILLPLPLLKKELERSGKVESVPTLLNLAKHFDVSLEALVRRLHQCRLFEEEKFAAILVDYVNGKQIVRAACYGAILLSNVTQPLRGMDFQTWIMALLPSTTDPEASEWKHTTEKTAISGRKIPRANRGFILDLQFSPIPLLRRENHAVPGLK
jgi:hypothetical protein